jgi:hypothetical protein
MIIAITTYNKVITLSSQSSKKKEEMKAFNLHQTCKFPGGCSVLQESTKCEGGQPKLPGRAPKGKSVHFVEATVVMTKRRNVKSQVSKSPHGR